MATRATGRIGEEGSRAPGRTLPLNSRRLTATVVRRIARGLGVEGVASLEDTRQIVDAKLDEAGHPPANVRVELVEEERGVVVLLRDDEGVVLECQPEEEPEEEHTPVGGGGERDGEEGGGGDDDGARETDRGAELAAEIDRLTEENTTLSEEVRALRELVERGKQRYKSLWRESCEQLREHDSAVAEKDAEIEELRARVEALEAGTVSEGGSGASRSSESVPPASVVPVAGRGASVVGGAKGVSTSSHRGKAPPIDSFDGESPEVRFDDWLPMLQRAATWNGWSDAETLLQLAGHLRKRALLEWNLLGESERGTLESATEAMRERLDPGSRSTAVQDFRHARQRESEPVGDFILRLERIFRSAYGRDQLSGETRDALLHGQLQEGLLFQLMEAPAVSGAQKYTELCVAVRNEEKRLESLKKRQRFRRPRMPAGGVPALPQNNQPTHRDSTSEQDRAPVRNQPSPQDRPPPPFSTRPDARRCFRCNRMGHLARECPAQERESRGRPAPFGPSSGPPENQRSDVRTLSTGHFGTTGDNASAPSDALLDALLPDSGDEVRRIRLDYQGSKPRHVRVEIQGVPTDGIVDTGADITIIGGGLFRKVAATARLKRRDLKRADRVPKTYDQRPFVLDGRMDLDISFQDVAVRTPVYIKMDSPTPLLLSEGVCCQLGIISYHPDVQPAGKGTQKHVAVPGQPMATSQSQDHPDKPHENEQLVQDGTTPPTLHETEPVLQPLENAAGHKREGHCNDTRGTSQGGAPMPSHSAQQPDFKPEEPQSMGVEDQRTSDCSAYSTPRPSRGGTRDRVTEGSSPSGETHTGFSGNSLLEADPDRKGVPSTSGKIRDDVHSDANSESVQQETTSSSQSEELQEVTHSRTHRRTQTGGEKEHPARTRNSKSTTRQGGIPTSTNDNPQPGADDVAVGPDNQTKTTPGAATRTDTGEENHSSTNIRDSAGDHYDEYSATGGVEADHHNTRAASDVCNRTQRASSAPAGVSLPGCGESVPASVSGSPVRSTVSRQKSGSGEPQLPSADNTTVDVRLLQSVKLLPGESRTILVETDKTQQGTMLIEHDKSLEHDLGIILEDAVFCPHDKVSRLVVSNLSGITISVEKGTSLGEATEVVVEDELSTHEDVANEQDITEVLQLPEEPQDFTMGWPQEEPTKPGAAEQPSANSLPRQLTRDLEPGGGAVPEPAGVTWQQAHARFVSTDSHMSEGGQCRQQRLEEIVDVAGVPEQEKGELLRLLREHHNTFSINEGERGETNLVEMEIDTGGAKPIRQRLRRMPFAVRREVAKQLRTMQSSGVIQPSNSPWSSPVVMVRKKDGSHRFCVDYRELNSLTQPDSFPLPRIDDLLDQLGLSRYFSTLDLAAGYWQIRMHPTSIPKTAFTTPQGTFEFRVMPFGLTNAPSVFQRLMQRVLQGLNPDEGPDFVSVYIDDVLVFSRSLSDHLRHLQLVMERIRSAGLKLKPSKCHFIRTEVEYLGHIITPQGLRTNPKIVSAVTEFPIPRSVRETRQFLGLCSYYRRFIPHFAKVARPLHNLTRKGAVFQWTTHCQDSTDTLKQRLTSAPVLAYPCFERGFILETDASIMGLGAVLSQLQKDDQTHPVAYASRALSQTEQRYAITELETLAVVWAICHFHAYLYGHSVVVYTDHSAVRAVLGSSNPSAKHARWWTKVYGSGIRDLKIRYRPGKANANADALSRCIQAPTPSEGIGEGELQVAVIQSGPDLPPDTTITELLQSKGTLAHVDTLAAEQQRDPELADLLGYMTTGILPEDPNKARQVSLLSPNFSLVNGALFLVDTRGRRNPKIRAAVPSHLKTKLMEQYHRGPLGSHFSGERLFSVLSRSWWWEGMHRDALQFVRNCPECNIVSGGGRVYRPPLHPIPVRRPFQILGVDIMDLPVTQQGNRHVVVFQDYLTKWPLVFPVPDQRAHRLAKLLAEEVVPMFGVPECLLSDRGANLLSHLMLNLCKLLGVKKLNTTSYHPQCNGMVERFNRTLKSMLRKHAGRFGLQWDRYLSGVLWAYRNTPHETTGEKPSFLVLGMDCRTPSEAALLSPHPLEPTAVETYREELILNLSSARQLAAETQERVQSKAKTRYDRTARVRDYRRGDWVLVRFPADETGRNRKLSQPWHGPYRVLFINNPDITVQKVYNVQGQIQVHQSRVTPWPDGLPPGYYWYGRKQCSQGGPPLWVERLSQRPGRPQRTSRSTDGLLDEELLGQAAECIIDGGSMASPTQSRADPATMGPGDLPGVQSGYGTSSGLLLPDHPGKRPSGPEARGTSAGMQSTVAGGTPQFLPVEMGLADTFLPALFSENSPVRGMEDERSAVLPLPTVDGDAPTIDEDALGEAVSRADGFQDDLELEGGDGDTPQLPTPEAEDSTDPGEPRLQQESVSHTLEDTVGREKRTKYGLRQRVAPPDRLLKLGGKLI